MAALSMQARIAFHEATFDDWEDENMPIIHEFVNPDMVHVEPFGDFYQVTIDLYYGKYIMRKIKLLSELGFDIYLPNTNELIVPSKWRRR